MIEVAPGTVVLYSDIACPWAHLAVHRFLETRRRLGLERIHLDHRAFPLEIYNRRPTPKRILDAEIPVAGTLEPSAGWQMWQRQTYEYPSTSLPALESVQCAKRQGLEVSERLDRALRAAFFGRSRCIAIVAEILEVAEGIDGLDADALERCLAGAGERETVFAHAAEGRGEEISGSPHFFTADGSSFHNPGIEMHWVHEAGTGFPVVDKEDPRIYEEILERAAGSS